MTDHDNPTRRFSDTPADGARTHLLRKAISDFLTEPQIIDLVDTIRAQFGLHPPSTAEELAENHAVDREAIRRRVCAVATETDWDEPIWFLGLIFDPDGAAEVFIEAIDEAASQRRVCCPNASQVRGELIRRDRDIKACIRAFRDSYLATDFPDLLVDLIVDIITHHAITGDYLPPAIPRAWFAYNIFIFPTPGGPRLFAMVTPATCIDQVTRDLKQEFRLLSSTADHDPAVASFAYIILDVLIGLSQLLFDTVIPFANMEHVTDSLRNEFRRLCIPTDEDRASPAESLPYNVFDVPSGLGPLLFATVTPSADIRKVTDELREAYKRLYVTGIRDRQPDHPERDQWIFDRYCAAMQNPDFNEKWAINYVLADYEDSAYRHHIAHHGLYTGEGERAAKAHIRDCRRRAKAYARQFLDQLDLDYEQDPDET